MTDHLMEIALRTFPNMHATAIFGSLISGAGVTGLVGARLLGVVTANVDPTFWAMILVGVAAAAGNAWVEFQWRKRRREIDAKAYERQKHIDIAIYEKLREKESGFEIDVLPPDPD